IVLAFYVLAPQSSLRFAFHQGQLQRFAFPRRALDRLWLQAWLRYVHTARTLPAQVPQRRQRQDSSGLQTLQQLTALVILQPATGTLPLQQFADGSGDLGHFPPQESWSAH